VGHDGGKRLLHLQRVRRLTTVNWGSTASRQVRNHLVGGAVFGW